MKAKKDDYSWFLDTDDIQLIFGNKSSSDFKKTERGILG